jgi:hypothetical protein
MMLKQFFTAIALVAVTAAPALADANADVQNAMIAFTKLSSYHMEITTEKSRTIVADYASPGRYHTTSAGFESIIIGPTMYMKMNGAWKKLPGSMGSMTDYTKNLTEHPHGIVVTAIGPRVVGGVPLRAYHVTDGATRRTQTVFLDGTGRVVRIETGSMVMTVSRFNAPISIHAPM